RVSQYLKNNFTRCFITVLAEIAPELKKNIDFDYDSMPSTPVLDDSEDDQLNPDEPKHEIKSIELDIKPITLLPMPAFSAHQEKQRDAINSKPTHRYELRDRASIKRPKY